MAKKSNKKPGQKRKNTGSSKNTAAMMKRKSSNLNEKKFTKFILFLMVLAFIGGPIALLIIRIIG